MIDGSIWLTERPKPKDMKVFHPVRLLQQKYDGRRMTFVKMRDGTMHAWSQELADDCDYWPKIGHRFDFKDFPKGSALDGEVFPEGAPASDAITAINEDWDTLKFVPFAIPFLAGKDRRLMEVLPAFQLLNEWSKLLGLQVVETHSCTFISPENFEDQKHRLIWDATERNIEGWVLKNAHYAEWWKIKPVKTVDAVITGWKEGKNKNKGLMGALLVSVHDGDELVEIASVGAWSDEDRASITPTSHTGRVMEVAYQSVQVSRLQFPRFMRWRDDKPAENCLMEQIR